MANDGKQIKLPLYSYGFPALCAFIAAIKQTADAAGSGVLQLSQGMQESLAEIEAALNDIPSAASITISTSGWVEDNEATHSYKYYYDITSEGTTADIGGTANALTVSKITKTDSGASITFQAAAAISDAHSSIEGLFVVKKDSKDVPLTYNLPVVAAANTDSTATCTIPSNTAAGDYVLQANAGGVASGTIKFTVALINGITDADKTITISAAAGGAGGAGGTGGTGGTDNKADFISFSKYLFTIFILFL